MTSILFGPKRSVYCPHAVGEFVFCKGDPNAEWPGTTWERHDEGVYLVAARTGRAEGTGRTRTRSPLRSFRGMRTRSCAT